VCSYQRCPLIHPEFIRVCFHEVGRWKAARLKKEDRFVMTEDQHGGTRRSGTGVVREFRPVSKKLEEFPLPEEAQNIPLDPESGFEMAIDEFTATFIPNSRWFGPEGNFRAVLEEPMTVGVIVNCLNDVWFVESEPTEPEAFGLLAYARQEGQYGGRKPILAGQGSVVTDSSGRDGVQFNLRTVYDFVRSSPRGDKIETGGSCEQDLESGNTKCKGEVKYTYEF
jgi:hypothetical protein